MSTISVARAVVALQTAPQTIDDLADHCSLSREAARKMVEILVRYDMIEPVGHSAGRMGQGARPVLWRWRVKAQAVRPS